MSAFLVTTGHINAILHYLRIKAQRMHNDLTIYHAGPSLCLGGWRDDETWLKAAQLLYGENQRSLRARYGNKIEDGADGFQPSDLQMPLWEKPLESVQVIKLCQCLKYQSCETKDYEDTPAHSLVCMIINQAISDLPRYDTAHWAIGTMAEGRTPRAK